MPKSPPHTHQHPHTLTHIHIHPNPSPSCKLTGRYHLVATSRAISLFQGPLCLQSRMAPYLACQCQLATHTEDRHHTHYFPRPATPRHMPHVQVHGADTAVITPLPPDVAYDCIDPTLPAQNPDAQRGACLLHGTTADPGACATACWQTQECQAFTWYSPPSPLASHCYFVDDSKAPDPKANGNLRRYSGSSLSRTRSHRGAFSGRKRLMGARNIYTARVTDPRLHGGFTGLRVNGARGVRARWPNADPERDLYPTGWHNGTTQWLPPRPWTMPPEDITQQVPNRSHLTICGEARGFCNYMTGISTPHHVRAGGPG